jgi:hypothetical protein
MKLPAHTLRRGSPKGWDDVLFSQFRRVPPTPEAQRVESILELLVAANTFLSEWQNATSSEAGPGFLAAYCRKANAEQAYHETLARLEEALKPYQWRSAISGDIDGFHEKLEWSESIPHGPAHWEHAILRVLLDRINYPGELSRIRRCSDCQNWFYAATSHQRFCGEACRRRYTARSPQFKEKRRRYMKQVYRPQEKQRESRSLAIAKGTVVLPKSKGGN